MMNELPPLPVPAISASECPPVGAFAAYQLRAYAEAAVVAEQKAATMVAHDPVTRILNEGEIKMEILRGMCIDAVLDLFLDVIRARRE